MSKAIERMNMIRKEGLLKEGLEGLLSHKIAVRRLARIEGELNRKGLLKRKAKVFTIWDEFVTRSKKGQLLSKHHR